MKFSLFWTLSCQNPAPTSITYVSTFSFSVELLSICIISHTHTCVYICIYIYIYIYIHTHIWDKFKSYLTYEILHLQMNFTYKEYSICWLIFSHSLVPWGTSVGAHTHTHTRGSTPKWNLFIENCVFILICLNSSRLPSPLHLMQYAFGDIFSTAQNSFWTHWFWCHLVPLLFFGFPLPHQKSISLWGLFPSGETKKQKCCSGWDWVNTVGGTWGSCHFWSKTAEHSACCEQVCW